MVTSGVAVLLLPLLVVTRSPTATLTAPSLPEIGAVTVNYTAGYGIDTDVPEGIKRWMLLRIGSLYAFREEIVAERSIKVDPMPFFDLLLDPFRVATA